MTVADQRVLRGVPATLQWQPVGSDGEAADPGGVVTVGVSDAAGEEVLPAGTATTGTANGVRSVGVPASDLNVLTATWSVAGGGSFTTSAEVVGGFYFTLAEARDFEPSTLGVSAKYPPDKLDLARQAVEDEFEAICQVAFVPRLTVEIVTAGSGGLSLYWPRVRAVRSVERRLSDGSSTYDADFDTDDFVFDGNGIIHGPICRGGTWRVTYEHGFDKPPPEVKAAALLRLRDRANVALRAIPDRATGFSTTEGGTYALDQASITKTGIPEVDAALMRWDHRSRIK